MTVRPWQAAVLVSMLLIAGCAGQSPPASMPVSVVTPAPTADRQPRSGAVRASGKVAPARKAELGFPSAGRVQSVAVDVGAEVQANGVLIALEKATAEGAKLQAQAALWRAQAHLAELRSGPRPQEITAAEAHLEAIQAQLAQFTEGARTEDVSAAKAEVAAAQAALQQLFSGPSQDEQIIVVSALSNAEAALKQAQAAYDRVSSRGDIAMLPESRQLQEATNNYKAAQARHDALHAAPNADVVASARARVQQAQAALDRLLNPATKSQIAQVEAQVRSAQAELDLLKAGARNETIAAAAADVTEAEAVLKRAEADLANTELRAPFTGTVTTLSVNPGEMVLPGQAVLTLADLSRLQVETTDLSERDVARVAVGGPAIVFVEALGKEIPGRVAQIAPQATVVAGDAVYMVTIELEGQPQGLRWGMSAQVDIAAD